MKRVFLVSSLLSMIGATASQESGQQAPPWPVALGLRVAAIERRAPVQDRVVLVPDEATFLDEVSQWGPAGRWPVLIEDDIYAPMFVRAFNPKRIVRRTERAPSLADATAVRTAIDRTVVRTFGGDPTTQSPRQAIEARGVAPTGIAAYAADDPAFVAAAALAAGHGMIPMSLEGAFGRTDDRLDSTTFAKLDTAVRQAFESTGIPFETMGDALDAIAICRTVGLQAAPDLPADRVPTLPGVPAVQPGDPVAVTDALCRGPDGRRFAVVGCVEGHPARSAYAAMCSLFLARETLLAVDCYGDTQPFTAYGLSGVVEGLVQAGMKASAVSGAQARRSDWRDRLLAGFSADVLFMNTSGNADFFDLGIPGQTGADDKAGPGDVPVLSRPAALHLIHSFSLQQPADRETVGGRWLEAGVYAYVGSVHEPYLPAFVPPAEVLERLMNAVPFAVAARHWDGPFAVPWRVQTLGDPLMLCIAPKGLPAAERVPAPPMLPGQEDAFVVCKAALERAKTDRDGAASADALRALVRVGRDQAAAQFWGLCAGKPWVARVAPIALEPLFRERDADAFLKAYAITAEPTPRQRDMLWQLWGQRIDRLKDSQSFLTLERAVRVTWPSMDWQRLLGPMSRVCGADRAQAALLKARDATRNPQQREALQELLKGG